MKVDGRCHCGAIVFKAIVDPDKVEICHCSDCQTLSGTAFRVTVPARRKNFELLQGALKTYVKVADSGVGRALTFCPDCGASIYSTAAGDEAADCYIRVGTLTQRRQLPPKIQYWTRSALAWLHVMADIPAVARQ